LVGETVIVETVAETLPAVKFTRAVEVSVRESAVSVAVNVAKPAVVEVTANEATPVESVVEVLGRIISLT
jgi:hypothetical protein